jgi:hypothetical protein
MQWSIFVSGVAIEEGGSIIPESKETVDGSNKKNCIGIEEDNSTFYPVKEVVGSGASIIFTEEGSDIFPFEVASSVISIFSGIATEE